LDIEHNNQIATSGCRLANGVSHQGTAPNLSLNMGFFDQQRDGRFEAVIRNFFVHR